VVERTKIKEYDGWPGRSVEHEAVYESGEKHINICSLEEWKVYEIVALLVANGADEKVVEELYSAAWSLGYGEAEFDAAENERL